MSSSVKGILDHMMDDAEDVLAFTKDTGSYEAFVLDKKTQKAVMMSLLNIGELANHLPAEFTMAHPEIPWRLMVGMRNLAAHGYHTMNRRIIWDTATTSIPELSDFLQGAKYG